MSDQQPAAAADQASESADTSTPPGAGTSATSRRVLASLFWLLASLSIMVGGVTVWAHQTLLTSNGWGGIVEDVIDDPEVVENISTVIVSRLSERLGVRDVVADVLPGSLDIVAGAITAGVEDRITGLVIDIASGETFQEAFVRANERAHDAAMAVIRGGDSEALTSEDGVITLNVLPLVEGVLVALQDAGLISADRDIPDLSEFEVPERAVAALETVLDREIPDDIGTIVLVDSENLALVQTAVRWFDLITLAMLALAVLFCAVALWLSERRIRMVVWLAGGAIAALAAGRLLARIVFGAITGRAGEADAGVTVAAITEAALDSLLLFTFALMVIALVIALGAWWWERARTGERPAEVTPPRTLGRWLRDNARIVLAAGLALIAFVVLWTVGGLELAMVTAAAVGLLLVGYQLLIGHREPGAADAGEPDGTAPSEAGSEG